MLLEPKTECESELISNCIEVLCYKEVDIAASSLRLQYQYVRKLAHGNSTQHKPQMAIRS